MNDDLKLPDRDNYDPEPQGSTVLAVHLFLTGVAITVASVFIGDSYKVSGILVAVSFFVTVFGRHCQSPWVFMASHMAALPSNWTAAAPGNLIFAFWRALFDPRHIFALPRWLYGLAFLSLLGFSVSSVNWMGSNAILNLLQQLAHICNFLVGPIVLLPIIFRTMADEKSDDVKVNGLLYFLIVPSTLVLLSAYLLGSPVANINADPSTGINLYRVANVSVNFTRTQVGFILSSLICASTAILISKVNLNCRFVALGCLTTNALLLLITGSVGSSLSGFAGIAVIVFSAGRRMNAFRLLTSVVSILALMVIVWSVAPAKVKTYVESRYEQRLGKRINAGDRLDRWTSAAAYMSENPEGVGWSLSYGDRFKSYPHNDYLLYGICYGVLGGGVYAYLILRLLLHFFKKSKAAVDPPVQAIALAGLGVVVVLLINSMSDHLVANKWYFNVIWSIIWYAFFCCQSDSRQGATKEVATDGEEFP